MLWLVCVLWAPLTAGASTGDAPVVTELARELYPGLQTGPNNYPTRHTSSLTLANSQPPAPPSVASSRASHEVTSLCVVCLNEPRAVVLQPCSHFAACLTCTLDLLHTEERCECPLCRTSVESYLPGISQTFVSRSVDHLMTSASEYASAGSYRKLSRIRSILARAKGGAPTLASVGAIFL